MVDGQAPGITVVIPTFNRVQWLQTAVESVLQETRVPIRLTICDNASTDETEAYVREAAALDSRISYERRESNLGSEANLARGFESITTEYFVPLADDDWLLPNFLFDAHQRLENCTEAGAAVFLTEVHADGTRTDRTYPGHLDTIGFGLLQPAEHLRDWMTYGHYAWSSILWRTETLDAVGPPYFHVGLPSDVDFQVQIFARYPVYLVNQPGAVYRLHEDQASTGFDMSHLRSWAQTFRRMDDAVRETALFDLGEYKRLRERMQLRYRGSWRRPPTTPLHGSELLVTACSAGFRLGDWELAFGLLDQFGAAASPHSTRLNRQMMILPELSDADGLAVEFVDRSNELGALPAILAWFETASRQLDSLRVEVALLRSEVATLKARQPP